MEMSGDHELTLKSVTTKIQKPIGVTGQLAPYTVKPEHKQSKLETHFLFDVQNFNGPRVEDWIASVRYMESTTRRGSSQTKGQRTQLSFRATIPSRLVATSRRRLSLRLTILTRRDGTRRSHVQSWTAGSLREQLHS